MSVILESQTRLESFEALALPHRNELFRAAISMLGRRAEAEDTVQEAFLQAWKSFDRFTPGTNIRAWLFQILFHVVSHHRRKWYNRLMSHEEPENLENMAIYEPPVPDQLRDEEILEAFRKLPQTYAEVVLLADVQEFSYKEIQDTLGIPIGTVMSRLSRGRRRLRQQLAHRAPAPGRPARMGREGGSVGFLGKFR